MAADRQAGVKRARAGVQTRQAAATSGPSAHLSVDLAAGQSPVALFRAVATLPEGAPVTSCYLALAVQGTAARRAELRESYFFTCECAACGAAEEGLGKHDRQGVEGEGGGGGWEHGAELPSSSLEGFRQCPDCGAPWAAPTPPNSSVVSSSEASPPTSLSRSDADSSPCGGCGALHAPREWLVELALLEELTADAWAAAGQAWPPLPPPPCADARTDEEGIGFETTADNGTPGVAAAAQALGFAARGPLRWVRRVRPAAAHCLLAQVEVGLRRQALGRLRRRRRWCQKEEEEEQQQREWPTEQTSLFDRALDHCAVAGPQGDFAPAPKEVPRASEETAERVDSSIKIVEGEIQNEEEEGEVEGEVESDEDEEGLELDSEEEADLGAALCALSAAVRQCPWLLDPVVAAKVHLHAAAGAGAGAGRRRARGCPGC